METNSMDNTKAPEPELSLRVAEAMSKDVRRCIARLDPKDLARIGASAGDLLAVRGERTTVVKAMPAYTENRGKGTLQIDGVTRGNAKTGIDGRVTVKRITHAPAARITLRPAGGKAAARQADTRYIGRLLEGLPVTTGDTVRVTLFGSRYQDFEVVAASPRDTAVVIHGQTQFTLDGGEAPKATRAPGISYEDVGGLRREMRRVREMIELPLRHPEVFERLGIGAPKGILLHGPPGTGKTLLARAVAHETEASFITVSGPEVIHKFYGESEAKLRGIFEQARKQAPCIVFLDEIDALAPKRENVQGEVEKRVVAQLLALMDGLEERGQVIVIGATNLPDLVDPALRRPGRFDREIEIGIPDAISRREILEIHSRGMPLDEDVDLGRIASMTHGFVGADLEALCREAAMTTLRAFIPESDLASGRVPEDTLLALRVSMPHFLEAFGDVEPSCVREVSIEVPGATWDDVGGLDDIKREIREAVEWPLTHAALLARASVRTSKGILLYGPPGTGKTLLARAAASQSGVNFISVKGPALLSMYVGESEKGVRAVFKKARQAAPCILFFDEIDALAPVRGGGSGDSRVTERVISQLLTEMDGVEDLKGVLVIAATNRKDILDPALIRPGRFDLLLSVPPPDRAARERIFGVHLRAKPITDDVDMADLAVRSEGLTGAEIETVCRRAALSSMRSLIASRSGSPIDPSELLVTHRSLLDALDELRAPPTTR